MKDVLNYRKFSDIDFTSISLPLSQMHLPKMACSNVMLATVIAMASSIDAMSATTTLIFNVLQLYPYA
jgi:hypothetical protein